MRTSLWMATSVALFVGAPCASAAPVLGPARSIGQPVSGSPAYGHQREAQLASDGTQFLAVWSDFRENSEYADVYAARVSPTGALLDPRPIRLGVGLYDQEGATVAFGGGVFLVVWSDERDRSVRGLRIAPDGRVLDPQPFPVFERIYGYGPRIAFDGTDFVVVTNELVGSNDSDLHVAWVAPDRSPTKAPLVLASGSANQEWSDLACQEATGLCLIAWEYTQAGGDTDVAAARVQRGSLLDAFPRTLSSVGGRQGWVAVTTRGTNAFFVAWEDHSTGASELRGTGVQSTGIVNNVQGLLLSSNAGEPDLAWNGALTVLTYYDVADGRVKVRTIDAASAVSAPVRACANEARQFVPAVAWGATTGLAVWTDERSFDQDLYASPLATIPTASTGPGTLLSTGGNAQRELVQSSNGQTSLLVWAEVRQGQQDLYFARVSGDGQVLDPDGVALAAEPYDQRSPAVAWLGSSWLVLWVDENRPRPTLMYRQIAADGSLMGTGAQTLSAAPSDQDRPRLVANAGGALVIFEELHANWDLMGLRFSPSGQPLEPAPFTLAGTTAEEQRPRLAAAGADFLVAWTARDGVNQLGRVASVSASGVPGTAVDVAPGLDLDELGLACSPRGCLLAWTDGDVWARPLSLSGTPTGVAVLVAGEWDGQFRPALEWRSDHYAAVWLDQHSRRTWDLVGARLQENGVSLDQRPHLLAPDALSDVIGASLQPMDSGELLLAYTAFDLDAAALRVRVRTWQEQAPSDGGTGFASLPPAFLTCGQKYQYAPTVRGGGTVSWEVQPSSGESLPEGLAVDAATGALTWTPVPGQGGDYHFSLIAHGRGWDAAQDLQLVVTCAQRESSVACSTAGASLALLLPLLLLRRRRRA